MTEMINTINIFSTKRQKKQSVILIPYKHVDVIKWRLLALCEWNPPITGGFPSQRPVTRSFAVSFDLHMNKRLSKQSTRRWFETPSRSLWYHCNDHFLFLSWLHCHFRCDRKSQGYVWGEIGENAYLAKIRHVLRPENEANKNVLIWLDITIYVNVYMYE